MLQGAMMALERPAGSGFKGEGIAGQVVILAATLLLAWGMIYYYGRVLTPLRVEHAQHVGAAGGNQSDLYPRWLGARELLWHHRSPYSGEVTREIQLGFYGRTVDPLDRKDMLDSEAFAYPVYVASCSRRYCLFLSKQSVLCSLESCC